MEFIAFNENIGVILPSSPFFVIPSTQDPQVKPQNQKQLLAPLASASAKKRKLEQMKHGDKDKDDDVQHQLSTTIKVYSNRQPRLNQQQKSNDSITSIGLKNSSEGFIPLSTIDLDTPTMTAAAFPMDRLQMDRSTTVSADDDFSNMTENINTDDSQSSFDDYDDYTAPQRERSKSIENKSKRIRLENSVGSSTARMGRGKYLRLTKKPKTIPHRYESTPYFIKKEEMSANQLSDLNWLITLHKTDVSGIFNDQTGTKNDTTLPIVAFFAHLKKSYLRVSAGPHLLVASSTSEINNWIDKFQKWSPSLKVIPFESVSGETKKEKTRNINLLKKKEWDICITSFRTLTSHRHLLTSKTFKWSYVVIDDAERIKNEKALISKTVRELKCQNRILITGKPMSTFNFTQLWALLNFMDPIRFDNRNDYVNKKDELAITSKPFIQCRRADDVLNEMEEGTVEAEIMQEQQQQQLLDQLQSTPSTPITVADSEKSDDWYQILMDDFMSAGEQVANTDFMASNDSNESYDSGTLADSLRASAAPPPQPSTSERWFDNNMPMIENEFSFIDVLLANHQQSGDTKPAGGTTDDAPLLQDMPLLYADL